MRLIPTTKEDWSQNEITVMAVLHALGGKAQYSMIRKNVMSEKLQDYVRGYKTNLRIPFNKTDMKKLVMSEPTLLKTLTKLVEESVIKRSEIKRFTVYEIRRRYDWRTEPKEKIPYNSYYWSMLLMSRQADYWKIKGLLENHAHPDLSA